MSTLQTNTISNAAGTLSVPVDTVVQGTAKAWVNFNGVGTVAIRAAFNVSSITDNGVGDYTVNFATAMVDANYSTVASHSLGGTAYYLQGVINVSSSNTRMRTNGTDVDNAYVAIFR